MTKIIKSCEYPKLYYCHIDHWMKRSIRLCFIIPDSFSQCCENLSVQRKQFLITSLCNEITCSHHTGSYWKSAHGESKYAKVVMYKDVRSIKSLRIKINSNFHNEDSEEFSWSHDEIYLLPKVPLDYKSTWILVWIWRHQLGIKMKKVWDYFWAAVRALLKWRRFVPK